MGQVISVLSKKIRGLYRCPAQVWGYAKCTFQDPCACTDPVGWEVTDMANPLGNREKLVALKTLPPGSTISSLKSPPSGKSFSRKISKMKLPPQQFDHSLESGKIVKVNSVAS